MIPLSRPDITQLEIDAVTAVLRTPFLSLGPKLPEFEQAIAAYCGSAHAVALSSGTAGLHLALLALGIREGDEVILPSFTFVAAANSIAYLRATPVFVDIDPLTLNLDPAAVEQAITPRTRAILLVHTFGCPANLDALLPVARRHNLPLVEDACEALGATWRGRPIGPIADAGVFSFYPNKPITTGEGGVLVTNNTALAETVRALRNQGRAASDDWLQHSLLGYNYRLPEINCALGLVQLSRLPSILARREALARRYSNLLAQLRPEIETPPADLPHATISWFAYVVRLPAGTDRASVIASLAARGIASRAYFPPLHLMPLYRAHAAAPLPVTEQVAARTLALPFYNQLSEDQQLTVCQALANT